MSRELEMSTPDARRQRRATRPAPRSARLRRGIASHLEADGVQPSRVAEDRRAICACASTLDTEHELTSHSLAFGVGRCTGAHAFCQAAPGAGGGLTVSLEVRMATAEGRGDAMGVSRTSRFHTGQHGLSDHHGSDEPLRDRRTSKSRSMVGRVGESIGLRQVSSATREPRARSSPTCGRALVGWHRSARSHGLTNAEAQRQKDVIQGCRPTSPTARCGGSLRRSLRASSHAVPRDRRGSSGVCRRCGAGTSRSSTTDEVRERAGPRRRPGRQGRSTPETSDTGADRADCSSPPPRHQLRGLVLQDRPETIPAVVIPERLDQDAFRIARNSRALARAALLRSREDDMLDGDRGRDARRRKMHAGSRREMPAGSRERVRRGRRCDHGATLSSSGSRQRCGGWRGCLRSPKNRPRCRLVRGGRVARRLGGGAAPAATGLDRSTSRVTSPRRPESGRCRRRVRRLPGGSLRSSTSGGDHAAAEASVASAPSRTCGSGPQRPVAGRVGIPSLRAKQSRRDRPTARKPPGPWEIARRSAPAAANAARPRVRLQSRRRFAVRSRGVDADAAIVAKPLVLLVWPRTNRRVKDLLQDDREAEECEGLEEPDRLEDRPAAPAATARDDRQCGVRKPREVRRLHRDREGAPEHGSLAAAVPEQRCRRVDPRIAERRASPPRSRRGDDAPSARSRNIHVVEPESRCGRRSGRRRRAGCAPPRATAARRKAHPSSRAPRPRALARRDQRRESGARRSPRASRARRDRHVPAAGTGMAIGERQRRDRR